MAGKTTTTIKNPPLIDKGYGRSVNLYLREADVRSIDEIARQMRGSRSDAIRWLISLTGTEAGPEEDV